MLRTAAAMCLRVQHLSTSARIAKRFKDNYTPRDNSGVQRRLKLIAEDEPDIEKAYIDHPSLEDLEQDIMEAAQLNDEALSEIGRISRMQKLKITEKKYFRPPKEPTMLTWSEKEQIVHLHQQDPEKWSPEVLAESFPASPAIIKKLLKNAGKWKHHTAERLVAYDRKVSENWIAFHKGELEVHDLKLKAHLAKFTDRKNGVRIISVIEAKRATEIKLPKPKRTEFLSLVTSFKPEAENDKALVVKQRLEDNIQPPKDIGERNLTNIVDKSGAYYTLDQYRHRLSDQFYKISEDREEIKAIINSGNKNENEANLPSETYIAPSERFKTNAVVHQMREKSKLKLLDRESESNRITIPEEKWKPGLVYRVEDCFYDDQGSLLYRVPGLKAE